MTGDAQTRPILLVEDNPTDLDLTRRAFARLKLTNPIEVARDGPLVVLLDLKLPRVEGLEVLRQLRADPVTQSLPVVVLTSSDEDRDIHAAYRLRANSYIVKPVNFEKLLEVVAQIEGYWCLLNQPPR